MTVSEIIALMRNYLDEPAASASDWDDETQLIAYINAEHQHLWSKVRSYFEDWQARRYVFPFVADTYVYWLPVDLVHPRRLESILATSVSGSAPYYTVNEATASPQVIDPLALNDRDTAWQWDRMRQVGPTASELRYTLFDDQLHFQPNTQINSGNYGRLWYLPEAPSLHRGVATAATSTSITLAATATSTTLGTVEVEPNYYQHMRIQIESGNGARELKRITEFNGSTRVATVDSAWQTTPNSSSVYSIVSPIKADYHELLALGAVMRAKGIQVEDDVSLVGAMYQALMADMTNNLERRSQQGTRRVRQT